MDVRQRFRELGQRVDELVGQIHGPAAADTKQPDRHEMLDGDLALRTSALIIGDAGHAAPAPEPSIRIPGISVVSESLITPVTQGDTVEAQNDSCSTDSPISTALKDELAAALVAPLVALGCVKSDLLLKVADSQGCSWAQWWVDTGADVEARATRQNIAKRHVGPWFAKMVLGSASPLLVGSDQKALIDDAFKKLVVPYVTNCDSYDGWQAAKAAVGVFASSGSAAASALTLAMRVLETVAENGQLLDVHYMLPPKEETASALAHGAWTEYVQIVATLPERIANKIDPRSIPNVLCPRPYFARLARNAVASIARVQSVELETLVRELWIKLCRVGQLDSLCVELASALAAAARTRMVASERPEYDQDALAVLARAVTLVPEPFGVRVVSGIVLQLDTAGGSGGLQALYELTLVVCALLHGQLDSGSTTDQAVSSLLTRFGATGRGVSGTLSKWSSMTTYQAIALALQLLAGKYEQAQMQETSIVSALPAQVYPGLVAEALERVVIPLWSLPELIQGVQPDAVKALAALALMCLSVMAPTESAAVSTSAAFTRAIPRFLDAPVPVVRLAGIIVADRVVSLAQQGVADSGAEDIDFGLDDIIRDAQTTDQPAVRASAAYIEEMRGYLRPVSEQWAENAEALADSKSEQTLADAVERLGYDEGDAVEKSGYDEATVLAPRQSTLTGDSGVQSAFVRPRKPVFLRDCLAYLRDRDTHSERIQVGLFALAECIERASAKAVEDMWVQVANKTLFTYNRGPDSQDAAWDAERQRALVALAVKLPRLVGPFLADRSCDRNLTMRDHELVLSAIATACLQLSGMDSDNDDVDDVHGDDTGAGHRPSIVDITQQAHASVGAGTVVRRSRRLDVVAREQQKQKQRQESAAEPLQQLRRQYAGLVGPAFFSPLVAQFGRSDMTAASDVRRDAGYLARYIDTLGVILYSAPAATHQLAMNREFWELARLVRRLPVRVSEAPPVLDALLFGIDVVLSPERVLSTPTLAREFRADVADTVRWISDLMERGLLREPSLAHAARIVARLREIQDDVGRRVTSSDFDQYTSII
ncbi:telomere binding protein [Coemansia erecta]|nr:telomere binding protein [Coemansia erecta]